MKLEVKSPEIPHPRDEVYAALVDPVVLARLLPGVEKFTETGPDQYAVEVKLGVGAIKGNYQGSIELFDRTPPEGYKLRGDAKGGPGWARGEAQFRLESSESGGTHVIASADTQVGGAIAGVGQRMMEGVAKSMAQEFFVAVGRELEGQAPQAQPLGFGLRVLWRTVCAFFAKLFGGSKT